MRHMMTKKYENDDNEIFLFDQLFYISIYITFLNNNSKTDLKANEI